MSNYSSTGPVKNYQSSTQTDSNVNSVRPKTDTIFINCIEYAVTGCNSGFYYLNVPEDKPIIGYKGFKLNPNGDLICRDMVYKLGEKYSICRKPELCDIGLHFCKQLQQVFTYYNWNEKTTKTAYWKVKAWGNVHYSDDKIAAEKMELVCEVSKEELLLAQIKPTLNIIDKILEDNPNVIIAGSLALILLGLIPMRQIGDIDVTLPYFSDFKQAINTGEFGDSGQETVRMDLNGHNFDLFLNHKTTYRFMVIDGKEYRVSDPTNIIEAKMRYLLLGKKKHSDDLIYIMQNMSDGFKFKIGQIYTNKFPFKDHINNLKNTNEGIYSEVI